MESLTRLLPGIAFLFILPLAASPVLAAQEIWLKTGEVRFLAAPPSATVRVGKRGVVRALDSDDGIRLIALKPGQTTVAVDGATYQVRVSFSAQREFEHEMRAAVGRMMGLRLYTDGPRIEVRGTLLRFSDWVRLRNIAENYDGDYAFLAKVLPDVAERALTELQTATRAQGVAVQRFLVNPRFTARISRSVARTEAEKLFAPWGIGVEVSESQLEQRPTVRTRVILAEVAKNFATEYGLSWPSEYRANLLPGFATPDALEIRLKALEAKGQAQILASPILICRSGASAEFHAGGEFPVRLTSRHGSEVAWKPHGVILNVKPRADQFGAISLEVETEVSLVDLAGAVDGVPALKRNRVKSHFDLPGKRTVALSGLLRQELGNSREGLPWLSRIPVLGSLFSSEKFLSQQTELVVFVTPEIYIPDADNKIEMPAGWVTHAY